MGLLKARDGIGGLVNFDVDGDGTEASPHLMKHSVAGIGLPADAAATSDAGNFTLIPLVKRLLGKLPSLVGGRIPVDTSTSTNPNDTSTIGAAASGTLKNSPGTLYACSCTNLNASTRYLQFFNSTTAPSAGATPVRSYPVYGSSGFFVLDTSQWGNIAANQGLFFSTGVSWGFSTTPLTFTAGAAVDCIFEARWQ